LAASVAKDLAKKKIVARILLLPAAVVPQAQQEPLEVMAVAVAQLLALDYQPQAEMAHFQGAAEVVAAQALMVLTLGPVAMAPLVTFASGAGNYGLRNP